jgi:hypothetical protein
MEVRSDLGCKCGCEAKAIGLKIGDAVLLVGSAQGAVAIADAILDAAAETWPGPRPPK